MDDLWAGQDNNQQLSSNTTGRGRWHRVSRLTEQSVVSSLRGWLLHDYATPYCRLLAATRIFRHCYWIDALGLDRKARPALQPVTALSQLLAKESKPITLHGLLLSAGSSKRKRDVTAGQNDIVIPKEGGILHLSWFELAPILIKELNQSPAIFLLNPLGASPFTYDDLVPLYQRTVPTELCLLISHQQIEMHLQQAREDSTHAATLTGLLRSDRWKTLSGSAEETTRSWMKLLIDSIQRHFLLPVQRIVLPVQVGPATIENMPYSLIFATRRQDSLICMNDAVCNYRRKINKQSWSGVLGEEWFVAQQQDRHKEDLEQLRQSMLQQGRAQKIRRWPDLRQQLLLANFGKFTLSEYDALIWQSLTNAEVRCEWRRLEHGQIPGNDDTLIWR